VVPIRAGGGTRVKILEAASHRCPIVSTTVGAEGLKVTGGRELCLADTPAQFAESCALLMRDAGERQRLAREALRWVRANHTLEQVRQALRPASSGNEGFRR
jgi:glycosyltransferase involved in cell wall biosynthesis